MTYTETAVTPELLCAVMGNLWERGREELRRLGLTVEDAVARFWWYAQAGRSGALLADGVPVLVAGIYDEGDESWTWFQSSEAFEQHAVAITRLLRRRIKEYPRPVFIYSVCAHPLTQRWFHALGCDPDGWTGLTAKGYPLRRFARR